MVGLTRVAINKKGYIVGIDVCCNVVDELLVGIDVKFVSRVIGELVSTCILGCRWFLDGCVLHWFWHV